MALSNTIITPRSRTSHAQVHLVTYYFVLRLLHVFSMCIWVQGAGQFLYLGFYARAEQAARHWEGCSSAMLEGTAPVNY